MGGLAPQKQSLTRLHHEEQHQPTQTTWGALVSLTLTPTGLRLSPAQALSRQLPAHGGLCQPPSPLLEALVHLGRG